MRRGSSADAPFSMLITTLEYDNYLGRVLTGRIQTGKAVVNMPMRAIQPDGNIIENGRLTKLLSFRGIERVPVEEARGRRHRRHRRPDRDHRRRHHLRSGDRGSAARPADRPADPRHDLLGQ